MTTKPAKSWAHLVATAHKKGVVISKSMQGMACISLADGTHLFSSRNARLQIMKPAEFESLVDGAMV